MATKNTIKTEIVYLSSLQSLAQSESNRLANCTDSTTKNLTGHSAGLIFGSGDGSAMQRQFDCPIYAPIILIGA